MTFENIELNVMFVWINLELSILAYAFFGFKIKRLIRKLKIKLKKGVKNGKKRQ